jgi:hypothetical protein
MIGIGNLKKKFLFFLNFHGKAKKYCHLSFHVCVKSLAIFHRDVGMNSYSIDSDKR